MKFRCYVNKVSVPGRHFDSKLCL
uniref:Uncharacterized protein n=1 Tax=Anguilla anguilla TaxID=7936 RepID=A0A0E9UVE1_ANGAN